MLLHRLFRPALVLCGPSVTLVSSCRDATAPRVHPLSGGYDFTTVLDSVSYEESGPLACGSYVMYCVKWRADSAGRLSGMFAIGDNIYLDPELRQTVYRDVAGESEGLSKGQAVQATFATGYASGPLTVAHSTEAVELDLRGPAWAWAHFTGVFCGDSIVGRLSWSEEAARHSTTYRGSFVARRRW